MPSDNPDASKALDALVGSSITYADQQILRRLMAAPTIELTVSTDTPTKELVHQLKLVCTEYGKAKKRAGVLKPLIGRMLLEVKEHRIDVITELGYQTWNDFLTRGCDELFALPRSEAYDAIALAENWARKLSPTEVQEVGTGKLRILQKFTNQSDPKADGYIKFAKTVSLKELREYVETRNLVEKGETEAATIVIISNKATNKMWVEFTQDPDIQGHVGTGKPDEILKAMIEECWPEWKAQIGEQARQRTGIDLSEGAIETTSEVIEEDEGII